MAVLDLNVASAKRVAARIVRAGGRAIAIQVDVSDPDSVKAAIGIAIAEFRRIDILVNGAALRPSPRGTVLDQSIHDWRMAFAVNLTGPFLMCKFAIPHLRKSKRPVIINIASQLGQRGIAGRSAYGSSKAALIQMTRSLAIDFASDGIRANSLSPGATLTKNMVGTYGSAQAAEQRLGSLHLTGRLGRPRDIAAGAVFLASDESRFMNAADLLLDGGYVSFKGRVTIERSGANV